MAMTADKEYKEKLIRNLKREVKQIMEEAVTRKFVHEESSCIISLCAAVEACLSHGLRRRALGLFKSSSTTALLHKVGKSYEPAAIVSRILQDIENAEPNKRSSSSSDSATKLIKPPLQKKNSSNAGLSLGDKGTGSSAGVQHATGGAGPRYLWIRIALFEKQLVKIIDHLVENSSKYYEKDALVSDQDYGSIVSSLLVGPCALDYSKMKTQDHLWSDPPADELVQRHRMSSAHFPTVGVRSNTSSPQPRRPGLNIRHGGLQGTSSSEDSCRSSSLSLSARDYVESLHQNNRTTLLYGKNNVLVLPKDHTESLPGYLSLHQTADILTIKWTPNQLMNGCNDPSDTQDKSVYWKYAMNVRVDDIVYVHCHQQADSGGTVVLVGQDGVQRSPIHFPKGGHLLAFLSCLETGLLPHGQLDPPLWSQRGKGKVFPKLRRKGRNIQAQQSDSVNSNNSNNSVVNGDDDLLEESTDYVFRVISKPRGISTQDMLEPHNHHGRFPPWSPRSPATPMAYVYPATPAMPRTPHPSASTTSSTSSSKSMSLSLNESIDSVNSPNAAKSGTSLLVLCETMKRKIISRAFYGWLAYCRHLRTVRTHLTGLVHPTIVSPIQPIDAKDGLTVEKWKEFMSKEDPSTMADEILRLTYFGGVAPELRQEVWPYLLGHVAFGSTPSERASQDEAARRGYETTMSEWLAVEAIVRQRDKEAMAATLAKLSSESTNGGDPPHTPLLANDQRSLSNDVFEDNLSIGSFDNPEINEDDELEKEEEDPEIKQNETPEKAINISPDEGVGVDETDSTNSRPDGMEHSNVVVVTSTSLDSGNHSEEASGGGSTRADEDSNTKKNQDNDEIGVERCTIQQINLAIEEASGTEDKSPCISPASSQGGIYTTELLETFGLNLHRIDKDVQRCDRNYHYFTPDNLEKLRNVMCTYVWEHLEVGYMQGMCDLVAPLLVIFDDEALTYACFCRLMDRMNANFPNGGAMDTHFANMRSLIQILDSEMFELMHQNGDYTHFYFCYRWFLLDFKRELVYDDVFSVWETIWAARHVASSHFVLFLALALVEYYREIILDNNMDFTDIIKFFNEMAERHDAKAVLQIARDLVLQLQSLIENK